MMFPGKIRPSSLILSKKGRSCTRPQGQLKFVRFLYCLSSSNLSYRHSSSSSALTIILGIQMGRPLCILSTSSYEQ